MDCLQIEEPSEPSSHNFHDNYFCKPKNNPYTFEWSYTGQISNLDCVNINEPSSNKVFACF